MRRGFPQNPPPQADDVHGYAIALYRELDNSYEEASVLHHLGDVHAALGEHADARELWGQALALYQVQGRENDIASLAEQLAGLE